MGMKQTLTEKAKQETKSYIARIEKLGKGASHKQLFRLQQAKEMIERYGS